MSQSEMLQQIDQFITELDQTQHELSHLFEQKKTALTNAETEQLLNLSQQEAVITERLKSLLAQRGSLLKSAKEQGTAAETLMQLARTLSGNRNSPMLQRMQQTQTQANRLRRESWVHWIVAQRTFQQYNELVNLIANHGKKSATYEEKPDQQSSGSVILDTSI